MFRQFHIMVLTGLAMLPLLAAVTIAASTPKTVVIAFPADWAPAGHAPKLAPAPSRFAARTTGSWKNLTE